jgi:hypothetical protein
LHRQRHRTRNVSVIDVQSRRILAHIGLLKAMRGAPNP